MSTTTNARNASAENDAALPPGSLNVRRDASSAPILARNLIWVIMIIVQLMIPAARAVERRMEKALSGRAIFNITAAAVMAEETSTPRTGTPRGESLARNRGALPCSAREWSMRPLE